MKSATARFEREARSVAALSHPNILAIHDFSIDNGVAYAVMELLDGATLRDRLNQANVSLSRVLDWAHQTAQGLPAAHERGVIHRDLKPENVFVTRDGIVFEGLVDASCRRVPWYVALLGGALAAAGERGKAESILAELLLRRERNEFIPSIDLSIVQSALRRRSDARCSRTHTRSAMRCCGTASIFPIISGFGPILAGECSHGALVAPRR